MTKQDAANPKDTPLSSEEEESSSEDEDVILEGVMIRNPDVSDSDDTSTSSSSSSSSSSKKQKSDKITTTTKKKKKKKPSGPELIQVEFTFCDMHEKYFHGLKTLLTSTSPVYAAQSSSLADLMIKNVAVGTLVSTEGDQEGTVFGYASVLNITTHQQHSSIQSLIHLCSQHCPQDRKKELDVVLSGNTKRPAGFYLQGRMVNLPLEIVEILHKQLVLDMDWAVQNAQDRKSLDFGVFVRLAPCTKSDSIYYKYFEDELFAQQADLSYEVPLPKPFGMEETPYCQVIVMTKPQHRLAMQEMARMIESR